jgi:hypothetical protein
MGTRHFVCNKLALLPLVRESRVGNAENEFTSSPAEIVPSKYFIHPINSITTTEDCK